MDTQFPTKIHQALENIIAIEPNPVLNQFIQPLNLFFDDGQEMDEHLAKLKTLEGAV